MRVDLRNWLNKTAKKRGIMQSLQQGGGYEKYDREYSLERTALSVREQAK